MLISSLSIGRRCLFKVSQEIVLNNYIATLRKWHSLATFPCDHFQGQRLNFTRRSIVLDSRMPQKSIASFFTSKVNKNTDKANTKSPQKLSKSPAKSVPKPVIDAPESPIKDSPIKKSGRKSRNRVISDSSEEDNCVPQTPLEENLKTTPKKEKSLKKECDSDDELPNPPRDVTITPKGSVKRKTARKSAPSKRIKTELVSVRSSEESEDCSGKTSTKNKVNGEMKNLEELFGVDATRSDNEEEMDPDDASVDKSPGSLGSGDSPSKESPAKAKNSSKKSPAGKADSSKKTKSDSKKTAKKEGPGTVKSPSNFFRLKSKKMKEEFEEKEDEDVGDNKKIKPEDYDPGMKKYHPIKHACWEHDQNVPYLAMARTFKMIEDISGRLRTIEILCNFLRSVLVLSPNEFHMCVYLSLNKLAPAYEGVELGIGESLLMKAIAEATGRNVAKIKIDAGNIGDLGLVAESSKSNQKMMFVPAPLTVSGVFKKLKQLAAISGGSSMAQKVGLIRSLLVACRQSEARYIIRSLGGKLRIGLAEQSVLVAIGNAAFLTPPGQDFPPSVINAGHGLSPETLKSKMDEHALIVKTTYCELPNYDIIIKCLLEHGVEELPKRCKLTPGIPLKPMLAHPTKGVSEVLNKFEKSAFTCEFKYDGERAQIHRLENGTVNIYSRNQENNTSKYPDIIERVPNMLKSNVTSCVIDSEAVAWDKDKQQILPFQVLSTRKRKDADVETIKVQVCIYAFDLLFLNGESLVRKPLRERRRMLRENFNEEVGKFVFATAQDTTDVDEIAVFLEESIKGNCEGLMVKTLDKDATYEIAKRSNNWLKLKKDYLDGMGDTLDLVVIGGYRGRGKRVGNFGGFLLACYDEESEEYQTICKIGTGFTDQDLAEHSAFFKEHLIDKPKPYYRLNDSEADQWFEPVQVWEVKAADLSLSPVYAAGNGIVDSGKGISLRFPRFIRIRDDKKPEEATNSSQVANLYSKQQQIQNQAKDKDGKEMDYY